MRHWRQISAIGLSLLVLVSRAETVAAQGFDDLPLVLGNVLAKSAVILDGLLGFLVVGNTLTDPKGEDVVAALGQVVVNFVNFFASLVTLF